MPRISSLRSIWTTASFGALLSLFVALCFQVAPAFGQGNYGEEKPEMDYMGQDDYMSPGMEGGNNQQAALVNVASTVKRPSGFSSVGSVRALLYGDVFGVVHFDFTKIDYEGLSSFLDELVDQGAGSVRSDDKYSVQLREYQKTSLKSSFKKFLSTSQNAVVAKAFGNNFDELYLIQYKSDDDKKLGALVVAVPTDGLDAAGKKKALTAIVDAFEPITVFERFGFIIGVVSHDSSQKANLEPIDARYQAKLAEKQSLQSYGAYGASSNNGNNGYGGVNDGYNSLGGASLGGANPAPGYGVNGQANSQGGQTNELGLSGELLRDYNEEVAEAKDKAKTESRRQVLPRIRNRFSEPASNDESADVFEALKQTNGAALAAAYSKPDAWRSLTMGDSEEGTPFSGLGAESDDSSSSSVSALLKALAETKGANGDPANDAASAAFALSLVGSPRLTIFYNYASAEKAQTTASDLKKGLPVAKVALQAAFDEAVKEKVGDVDDLAITVAPLFNELFEALEPVVVDTKVAMTFDLEPVKTHASVFMPLLGGVASKTAKEVEEEGIDWDLGEGDKAASNDDEVEEDDPYFDDEDDSAAEADEEDDEDSPFDDEDEEEEDDEDPFA